MKLLDVLTKTRLASVSKLETALTGDSIIAEHLQDNAECSMRGMLDNGDTHPLDSLHADNLGGPLHESKYTLSSYERKDFILT